MNLRIASIEWYTHMINTDCSSCPTYGLFHAVVALLVSEQFHAEIVVLLDYFHGHPDLFADYAEIVRILARLPRSTSTEKYRTFTKLYFCLIQLQTIWEMISDDEFDAWSLVAIGVILEEWKIMLEDHNGQKLLHSYNNQVLELSSFSRVRKTGNWNWKKNVPVMDECTNGASSIGCSLLVNATIRTTYSINIFPPNEISAGAHVTQNQPGGLVVGTLMCKVYGRDSVGLNGYVRRRHKHVVIKSEMGQVFDDTLEIEIMTDAGINILQINVAHMTNCTTQYIADSLTVSNRCQLVARHYSCPWFIKVPAYIQQTINGPMVPMNVAAHLRGHRASNRSRDLRKFFM